MSSENIKVVVLAAGKGTRMKSERPKVMHELFFAPMLHHVLAALAPLALLPATVVVTGHRAEEVEASLASLPVGFARQEAQLGTAHAVLAAAAHFREFDGTVLILCGDTPLLRTETIEGMLAAHRQTGNPLTVMTTSLDDPTNYGRIVTGPAGEMLRIVEEKDATPSEKTICEINAGVYCVEASFLREWLPQVNDDNRQKEFYLTDLVAIARAAGLRVERFFCPDPLEVLGVNSRLELAAAHRELQLRRNRQLMAAGVTIIGPETVEIAPTVEIGRDSVVAANVTIAGASSLGEGCRVGPQAVICDSRLAAGVTVEPFCHLVNCDIAAGGRVVAGTFVRQDG